MQFSGNMIQVLSLQSQLSFWRLLPSVAFAQSIVSVRLSSSAVAAESAVPCAYCQAMASLAISSQSKIEISGTFRMTRQQSQKMQEFIQHCLPFFHCHPFFA